MKLEYVIDPMGNRVWKETSDGVNTDTCKYIVDINSNLPVILCVLDGNDPNILKSSYVYADAKLLTAKLQLPKEIFMKTLRFLAAVPMEETVR